MYQPTDDAVPHARRRTVAPVTFAQYVAQRSDFCQACHRGLELLTAASLGLIVAFFLKALFVSAGWSPTHGVDIPFWWLAFATSLAPIPLLFGLDAIILRAAAPDFGPGRDHSTTFTTGPRAVLSGLFTMVLGLTWGGLAGATAYGILTGNYDGLATVISIFTTLIVLAISVRMIPMLVRDLTRALDR